MSAALTPTLINKDFKNWLKGALAVLFAKEGLIDLVRHESIDFQIHLLQTVYTQKGIPPGTTCSSCTTANVLVCPTAGFCSKGKKCKAHDSKVPDKKPNKACPNGLCSHIRDAIKTEHRFNGPSWKNTDARKWCSDAFELGKCFMPPDGYSDKTCLADTDFNGILAVVINNNLLQRKLSVNLGLEPNICTEARIIGRAVRHSANHLLSDQDLTKYIDGLIALLSDPAYLAADVQARNAVGKLKQLKTNTLTIHADDITNVLNESIKTTFDNQQKVFLHEIQDHFKKHKNDSVEEIDRKIQESVNKQLAELKAQTEKGRDELNAETEIGKAKLKLQSNSERDELHTQVEQGKDLLNTYTKTSKDELRTQLEQGKDVLNACTKKGKFELQTQLEQGRDILNTYAKVSKDELRIQLEQGQDILNTQITTANIALNAQTKTIEHKLNDLDETIALCTRTVDSVKHKGVEELREVTNEGKKDLEVHSKQVLEEINRYADINTGENSDTILKGTENKISLVWWLWDILTFKDYRLKLALKEDLISNYREQESMIPAAPLVEEHKVPIEDLYVPPPMWAYTTPFGLGKIPQTGNVTPGKHANEKQKTTISQLFHSVDVRYKKIYITANAGFGKTSLSQKLTMTWCQAHSPLTQFTEKYKDEELAAMKFFDFLFLLHLRDYQSKRLCNLDDMIMQMLSNNLSRNTLYSKDFLQRQLHEKNCLVLIDGLDEWTHPDKCNKTPAVPHNNHPDSCTVLTTSRSWKLGTISLSEHNIDRHIEISALDDEARNHLETNAIQILNERNLNLAGKTTADFDEEIKTVQIGDIIHTPFILLQLMCLFFGGLPIGISRCQIYSNITEFTLERGLNKKDLPIIDVQPNDNAVVPTSMKENEKCKRHFILLMKLGKLAFYNLFSEKKELSLVFDRRLVAQYMTEQEIDFCLKVGLLCQTKDSSIIAFKRYQVFFQHKSVQEFFSAIYITSEWQNESVKSTTLNVCSSLSSILEISNVFVFMCGMNPEVYACISGELQKIGDLDVVTRRYTDMYINDASLRTICFYQSMQIQCLQESMRNGNESCPFYLNVILDVFPTDLTALNTVIRFNKGHVKSLLLSDPEDKDKAAFLQSLDPGVFTSLEILRIEYCNKEPKWFAEILTESTSTLKCLTLSAYGPMLIDSYLSLSDISTAALTGLTCLQFLYLHSVHVTHSNLKCLYSYISQTKTLTQLRLAYIYCSDHEDPNSDCDVNLDMHLLNDLERVELGWLKMPRTAWQKLLLSVSGLPLPVTVVLSDCQGPSRQEWLTILNVIKTTPALLLLDDFSIKSFWGATLTLKKQ